MGVIAGVVIWILAGGLLGPLFAGLALIKLVVVGIYCCRGAAGGGEDHPVELTPLSPGDDMFAVDATWVKSASNCGFVMRVEGEVDVDRLREHFDQCFFRGEGGPYERLGSYIVKRGGYTFRACSRSRLVLDQHILGRRLQGSGDSAGEETLEEFLARWVLQSYAEHRPCWEMAVVPLVEQNRTAVAFKIHHSLCDGYSLVHILDKLSGTKSPYLVKDFPEGFWTQVKQILTAPLNLASLAKTPVGPNPFKVTLPPVPERGHEWLFSFTSFSLEDLKSLRRTHGNVHLSAVLFTIISGACRQFLLEEQAEIPEETLVALTFPWPRHPAMDPGTRNTDKICNQWSSGVFPIPLREPDPLVRLSLIDSQIRNYLSLGLDKFAKRVMYPLLWTLPKIRALQSAAEKDIGLCYGITSLVGGDSYSLLGAPASQVNFFVTVPDNAPYIPLNLFTFSHSGRLELTWGAHPRCLIKNAENLHRISYKLCQEECRRFLALRPTTTAGAPVKKEN